MLGIFLSTAFAQTAATVSSAGAKPTMLESLFPFAIILIFFYLFIGRPQQRKLKEQQSFLSALKRGDQVITSGGIYGEITGITDKFITLQVADNVRIKILRTQILGSATKEGNP